MFFPFKHMPVGTTRHNHTLSTSLHKFKSQAHQTLHSLLHKCSSVQHVHQIRAQIILHSLTKETLTLAKLISFAALSPATKNLRYAKLIYTKLPHPNRYIFNSLIRGYSKSENPVECLLLYRKMMACGLYPNEFTFPFVLKACACEFEYWVCVVIHGQAEKLGFGFHACVQNALINAYVVCGFVEFGRKVFDGMSERMLVSWNSMIGGYSKLGSFKEAFLLFLEMRGLGLWPDKFTLVSLLSVCSRARDVDSGRFVHLFIEISGVEIDLIVWNALLDMYAKCGCLDLAKSVFEQMPDKNVVSWTSKLGAYVQLGLVESAREVFEQMPLKNVVSWNSMISCYVQEGRYQEALDLFREMCNVRVVPDKTTLVCALSACSHIGDLVMGKKIHDYITSNKIMPSVSLCNSLIDMYAKCGALMIAMDVFSDMPNKNLVSWNVIIGALALHGHGLEAIKLFEKMQAGGIWPDEITFTGLLSACSHGGLVDMGRYYFDTMRSVYGISHEIEHYACMVDLLGRDGLLQEAVRLIAEMPMKPDIVIWSALLGACRTQGNIKIGKQILKQLLELEPYSSGVYVLLSNLYSEAHRWKDVKNIRKLINDHGIIKSRAISFIEIEGRVYEFMVDDNQHDASSNIYWMLDQLNDHLKAVGFLSNISTLKYNFRHTGNMVTMCIL